MGKSNGYILIDVLFGVMIAAIGMGAIAGGVAASVRASRGLERNIDEHRDFRNEIQSGLYDEILPIDS